MLPRVLEPEAMDDAEEARQYDAMDHSEVNARFVADFLRVHGRCRGGEILDVGTGTGRIPIALCQADAGARLLGLDLSEAMLELARQHVVQAGLGDRIRFETADAKALRCPDEHFEGVISNTIVHHLPDPAPALAEMVRVLQPGGTVMVRDLVRPDDQEHVAHLVEVYAGAEPEPARRLFQASLNAALTIQEVREIVRALNLPPEAVVMSSDRHWTWTWRKPL